MKRRNFLKSFSAAGLVASAPVSQQAFARADYTGPIYITIQAAGGWDATSFVDPKTRYDHTHRDGSVENIVVNRWSNTLSAQTVAGTNIQYAPFADNANFFTRHASKTMVLNGVDMQTNSHEAGTINNWSGRFAEGFPTFTALVAYAYGEGLPMAFISNGGYAATAGITTPTLLNGGGGSLRNLASPNKVNPRSLTDERTYFAQTPQEMIKQAKADRLQRLLSGNGLPFTQQVLARFASAQGDQSDLANLELNIRNGRDASGDDLPDGITASNYADILKTSRNINNYNEGFLNQIELTLAACASNITVAADLRTGGFDTHGNHDTNQANALMRLTDGIDFLWLKAEALGIADRIRLVIGSEFSRTPRYNDGNGKDHWPINSIVLMQQPTSTSETGRNLQFGKVFGASTAGHIALPLNTTDLTPLAEDSEMGVKMQPKHVHQIMRRWAGIENDPISAKYDLEANDLPVNLIV